MQNKTKKPTQIEAHGLKMPTRRSYLFNERRLSARSNDLFYRFIVTLNIISWVLLIISLLVFHYARPEFITGVQVFWGIDGREFWSKPHLQQLLILLQSCLGLSLVTMLMRTRRNRRKNDSFGTNLLILFSITGLSLLVLYLIL